MTAHESVFEIRQKSIWKLFKYISKYLHLHLNTFIHEVFVLAFVIDVYLLFIIICICI